MKIAYCVVCHKNSNILRTMIELLYEDNDIYIHVDKKSNIEDFEEYNDKVIFLNNRINVKWAGYSLIEATLNLLECALQNDTYDYICLVSGDCLPLKSSNEIKKIFYENKGYEFIGIDKNTDKNIIEKRIRYVYPSIYFKRNKNIIDKIIIHVRSKLRLLIKNKYYKQLPQLYKGSEWFCISGEFTNYIIEYIKNNPFYLDAFKYAYCGDEIFFQTIAMNSKYKDKIYNLNKDLDDNKMALRYIDWTEGSGHPKVLGEEDFDIIKINENCIFARKFKDSLDIDKYKSYFIY